MEIEYWLKIKNDFERYLKTHRQDLRCRPIQENKELVDKILGAIEICKKRIMQANYEIKILSR